MRVAIGKALRVGPGDEVVVTARLSPPASLGRLFVFVKQRGDSGYSPYVPAPVLIPGAIKLDDKPPMQMPLYIRLTSNSPLRELKFDSDVDGSICVMQEIDTFDDPRVAVKLQRRICPSLPWKDRLIRRLTGLLP